MKTVCVAFSSFLIIAGSWFALMELWLRHPNSLLHAAGAALIVVYSSLTIAYLHGDPHRFIRPVILLGALCAVPLGIAAAISTLRATDFEGYILLIGLTLAMQGLLTLTFTLTHWHLRHA